LVISILIRRINIRARCVSPHTHKLLFQVHGHRHSKLIGGRKTLFQELVYLHLAMVTGTRFLEQLFICTLRKNKTLNFHSIKGKDDSAFRFPETVKDCKCWVAVIVDRSTTMSRGISSLYLSDSFLSLFSLSPAPSLFAFFSVATVPS
jgi:hypothetical protein